MQQRAHLGLAAHVLVEPQLVGDLDRHLHDVLGVVRRCTVVLLEQVAQQQRGAAVRPAELEALLDAALALALEAAQQSEECEDEQRERGVVDRRERGQQAERREQEVDALCVAQLSHEGRQRHREDGRALYEEHRGVRRELGGERRDVGRPVLDLRFLSAERDDDECRRQREPAVHEHEQGAP